MLAEKYHEQIQATLARYPADQKRSAVMPLLYMAQSEYGYITKEAMEEVATGLNRMYEIRANSPKSGLLPSEVTVVFNISASATDKGKLFIEAGAKAAEILKVTGVGAEVGTQVAAARGNTVTVKFTNVLFAPKDTLVMHKSPEDLKKLLEVIKQSGIEIQMIE